MASFAYTDAVVTVNGTDLSSYVTSLTLNVEAEELEDTAMGDDWRTRLAGLKDWSVDIEWNNDFGASAVDATLWPLFATTTTLSVKPTSATTSATNPDFSGSVLISQINPLDGSVGDLAKRSTTWPGAGELSRATS